MSKFLSFRTPRLLSLGLAFLAALALAACAPTAAPQAPTQGQPPAQGKAIAGKLTIGLLPIIDSLPFYVAEQEGFFKQQGVDVELTTFASALERDTAIQANQIDGQLADLIASGLLNKERERIKIVKTTYAATPQKAQISIVAGPKTAIKTAADLKGKQIGISQNSLIDYITDRLLAEAGMKPTDVQKVEVSKIPVRMEMLSKGQLDAATLPEPLATLAVNAGGRVILDDGKDQIGLSVLLFRNEVLKDKSELVKRVVAAHEQAVKAINRSPEKYQALLAEKANLPESLKTTFKVPSFPENKVPTEADVKAAVEWMMGAALLPKPLAYNQMVEATYLVK